MTERGEDILSYLRQHRDDFTSLLKRLVEAESPSSEPETLEKPFGILRDAFNELCFQVDRIPGEDSAGCLHIKPKSMPDESPYQMMLGHCDTVWPVGTIEEMPCTITGKELSGPGSYDMKAGLCMMVFALKAIQELGKTVEIPPVILINSDEEVGSHDSEDIIEKIGKKASRVFVLEPSQDTDGKIKTRRKGVGHFDITVKGKASHAGIEPQEGVSASLGRSHVVQQIFDLNDPSKGITVNVGTIQGGERSNVVAAKSKATVDVRVQSKEDATRVENVFYNLEPRLEGIELEVEGEIGRPPLELTPANEKLWNRAQKLAGELDLQLSDTLSGGASDGNITSQHTATLDGLGAVGEGAHATHEKIYIEETLKRCALLSLLLLEPELD